MDVHPTRSSVVAEDRASGGVWHGVAKDAAHELPEIASALVTTGACQPRSEATAPDGEGSSEGLSDFTEPFAIALAADYERGATHLARADEAPHSLRSRLAAVDDYLPLAGGHRTGQRPAKRSFSSPLGESVTA